VDLASRGAGPIGATEPSGRHWPWLSTFLIGLVLWIASIVVTAVTGNSNLIPTVVLLGSFLVPITAVIWNFDHEATSQLSIQRVFYGFLVGGVLGVLAASLLEAWLVQDGVFVYLVVGFIEEFAKLLALVVVSRGLLLYTTRDGIALGAAVGFGFAALESSGYAFNALFTQNGVSLSSLVMTEILRGLLAPLGHGLWTAILGGVLFHAAQRHQRLRLSLGVVGAFALVSLLHALWDSMRGIAILITAVLTATPSQIFQIEHGVQPALTAAQVVLFLIIQFGGMIVTSAIGLAVLIGIWRAWARKEPASVLAPQ
jgi:RsiW-degrading membrane proteinase PrsW (M82 family)